MMDGLVVSAISSLPNLSRGWGGIRESAVKLEQNFLVW